MSSGWVGTVLFPLPMALAYGVCVGFTVAAKNRSLRDGFWMALRDKHFAPRPEQ
jgi:hypothetical protein